MTDHLYKLIELAVTAFSAKAALPQKMVLSPDESLSSGFSGEMSALRQDIVRAAVSPAESEDISPSAGRGIYAALLQAAERFPYPTEELPHTDRIPTSVPFAAARDTRRKTADITPPGGAVPTFLRGSLPQAAPVFPDAESISRTFERDARRYRRKERQG